MQLFENIYTIYKYNDFLFIIKNINTELSYLWFVSMLPS